MLGFLILLIAIPLWFWEGYVALCFWSWFAVPLGLPEVALVHKLGLTLLFRIVSPDRLPGYDPRSDDEQQLSALGFALIKAIVLTVILFIGYALHVAM